MQLSSKKIAALAAGFAAGTITESALRADYGDDLAGKIMAIAGGFGVGVITEQLVESLLDTEIGRDITDVADDVLDATVGEVFRGVSDIFDW